MFKVLKNCVAPTRGSKHSACVDLYASEDIVICAGETKAVGLGVCIDMETWLENTNMFFRLDGDLFGANVENIHDQKVEDDFLNSHYFQLMLRSSLGKKGLILPNGVGVIDLDYTDEITMIIHKPLTVDVLGTYTTDDLYHEFNDDVKIKKGDKIAQITLLEHKSYLFGIDSDAERVGGFGSTDNG